MSRPSRIYYVETTTCVDRPHLRGAGYVYKAQPHERITIRQSFRTAGQALAYVRRLEQGEETFGSEYCSEVQAWSRDLNGNWPRTLRRPIYFVRDSGADKPVRCADEPEQFERRVRAKLADEWAASSKVAS